MTSSTQKQIIAEHILPNISRSKSNQAMKLSQLIKYNVRNIFQKKSCRELGRETIPFPFFLFVKALYEIKASGQQLCFNIF